MLRNPLEIFNPKAEREISKEESLTVPSAIEGRAKLLYGRGGIEHICDNPSHKLNKMAVELLNKYEFSENIAGALKNKNPYTKELISLGYEDALLLAVCQELEKRNMPSKSVH